MAIKDYFNGPKYKLELEKNLKKIDELTLENSKISESLVKLGGMDLI